MREISRDELIKEYESMLYNYRRYSLGYEVIPKSYDNDDIARTINVYLDNFMKDMLKGDYSKLNKKLDKCLKNAFAVSKTNVDEHYTKGLKEKLRSKTKNDILELDEKIKEKLKEKYQCKESLDSNEISEDVYESKISKIDKEKSEIFNAYIDSKIKQLQWEVRKIRFIINMKKVLKFLISVLPVIAAVFLLKKAKDMPEGTKNKVLTLGKETIETIRASKNTKTVGTTKEVLQRINNTKTLNNNISLDI